MTLAISLIPSIFWGTDMEVHYCPIYCIPQRHTHIHTCNPLTAGTLRHEEEMGSQEGKTLWVTPCKACNGKIHPPRLLLIWWALLLGSGKGAALNVCVLLMCVCVCVCVCVCCAIFFVFVFPGHQGYIFIVFSWHLSLCQTLIYGHTCTHTHNYLHLRKTLTQTLSHTHSVTHTLYWINPLKGPMVI